MSWTNTSSFAGKLQSFATSPALSTECGRHITYAELCALADAFAAGTKGEHSLLLIEMSPTPEAVAAYVGALRARIPVILASPGTCEASPGLLETFSPDYVYREISGSWILENLQGDARRLPPHPDLAVLLSTSGSTGSPKLVKLSIGNVSANAASIAEYLGIDNRRVAITNLPLHYSYGLSVLNSFLASGARVVLTDLSVVDPCFRALAVREGVTDLAGVPYTYELLERSGFRDNVPPTLRVMTQAGGRLPSDLVSTYASFARDNDLRFYVMYGQTEATARMAYLPLEHVEANPGCIGIAIPGGEFSILGPDGVSPVPEPGVAGELVYRGPNVMMGYAFTRDDLAAGPSLEELRTGDIALREPNGLFRIVGRASRFSKIAGLRIGFDDVERIVREARAAGFVTGTDDCIAIALTRGDPTTVARHVSERCGLPQRLIAILPMATPPTLVSGKIDYEAIKRDGVALLAQRRSVAAEAGAGRSVAAIFCDALSLDDVDETRTFVELGGDSLTFAVVSLALERAIGSVPEGWQGTPIATLQALLDEGAGKAGASPSVQLGSDVILRLIAISMVFLGHGAPRDVVGWLKGGSVVLFMLAGLSFATYQVPQLLAGGARVVMRGALIRLVLPYFVLMTVVLLGSQAEKSPAWYLLGTVFTLTPDERGVLFPFWFIETLVHAMLFSCLLTALPPVRAALRTRPFELSVLLMLVAGALCFWGASEWPNGRGLNRTLDGWLYAFFLGWAMHYADTPARRAIAGLLAVCIAVVQFGPESSRPWWFLGAISVLVTMPSVRLPRSVAEVMVSIAGATYFMYLAHPVVMHFVLYEFGSLFHRRTEIALVYLGSVIAGLVYARAWREFMLLSRRGIALIKR